MLSEWIERNKRDIDIIVNAGVVIIPIILLHSGDLGFVGTNLEYVIIIILGVLNYYSSKIRRDDGNEVKTLDPTHHQ